jgi:peptidoglycan hydrolase-like protein with peptidoglycan-binding domain
VFFNFPNDGLNRISHIGIVLKKLGPGRYLTIEGNVGHKVNTHERTMRSIVGFGRLKFDADEKPEYRKGGLRAGDTGDRVRFLQSRLNQIAGPRGHKVLGFRPLMITGTFGPNTEKVVKVFQENRRLEPSGIVGPRTWARL